MGKLHLGSSVDEGRHFTTACCLFTAYASLHTRGRGLHYNRISMLGPARVNCGDPYYRLQSRTEIFTGHHVIPVFQHLGLFLLHT